MRAARQSRRSWVAVTTILLATLVLVLAPAATSSALVPCGLDPAFGAGGVLVSDLGGDDYANGLAVRPGGSIAVARLNPDGTRDTSFGGGDGVVYLDLQGQQDEAAAVAVDSAGRIVVAGRSWVVLGNSDAVVVRLLPDGSPDPSFGNQGVVVLNLRTDFDAAYGLALQADGALLVAGSYQPSVLTPWLARLHADGTRDRR